MKCTWAQKGSSSTSEAGPTLTGRAMPDDRVRTVEDFFRQKGDVLREAGGDDGGTAAGSVVVNVTGGFATADSVAESVAIADWTDTVVPTAVSAAGTADLPLTGAARGTAAERDFPVAVALQRDIYPVAPAGVRRLVAALADQTSDSNRPAAASDPFEENSWTLQKSRARPCRLICEKNPFFAHAYKEAATSALCDLSDLRRAGRPGVGSLQAVKGGFPGRARVEEVWQKNGARMVVREIGRVEGGSLAVWQCLAADWLVYYLTRAPQMRRFFYFFSSCLRTSPLVMRWYSLPFSFAVRVPAIVTIHLCTRRNLVQSTRTPKTLGQ